MDTATSAVGSGPAINTRSEIPGYLGPDVLRRGAEEITRLHDRITRLQQKADAYDVLVQLLSLVDRCEGRGIGGELSMAYALQRAATELEQERCPHKSVSSEWNHGMSKGMICDDCGKVLSEETAPNHFAGDFQPPMAYHGAELPRSQSSTGGQE